MLAFIVVPCQSCFKEFDDTNSLISKKHDFVASVISPDSTSQYGRAVPIEVFVGKIVPAKDGNIFFINGVCNQALYQLLYDTRLTYRIYYEYDSTASVYVKTGSDSVQLTYTGFGIYRNLSTLFSIENSHTYRLTVEKIDGKVYSSETTIPDPLKIIEPTQDTVGIILGQSAGNDLNLKIEYQKKPVYFILYAERSNIIPWRYFYTSGTTFDHYIAFTPYQGGTEILDFVDIYWEIRGVDTNFARYTQPTNFTGTDDFWKNWYHKFEDLPITERSNIKGSNDVTGVFGSYCAASKKFTAIPVRDSLLHK